MQQLIEVLLVEDNEPDAELTILALRKSHILNNIVHLIDGSEAVDFLFGKGQFEGRDITNKPSLILLDLKMPKVGGIELLKIIKADAATKKIPVVILTSSKESPDIEKCFSLGANSYIVKPVDFDNFMKAIGELGFYWMFLNQRPQ